MQSKSGPVFARTTVNIKDRRAEIAAGWETFGPPVGGEVYLTLADQDTGSGVAIVMSWEQARELRHRLSVAIEAAISSGVSINEAVQRG